MIKSIICFHCQIPKTEDQYYPSSLKKQDFTCSSCSVKKGNKNRNKRLEKNRMGEQYRYAKSSAKTSGKPFLLTEEEYACIASKPCFYCENPINTKGIGLDRINNDKSIGYTVDNVLPCCWWCNKLRNNILTVEETKVAVKAVQALRKSNICDINPLDTSTSKDLHAKTTKTGNIR
jgi:hypothetical protein